MIFGKLHIPKGKVVLHKERNRVPKYLIQEHDKAAIMCTLTGAFMIESPL